MPLKVVHIADLHAGKVNNKTLNRNEDLLHSLEQVFDLIKEEKPDYLIVAGDIFDKSRPDSESSKIVGEFFIKVAEEGTKVIAIGGNHDGASFLEIFKPWAKGWNIKIFPKLELDNLVYTDGEVAIAVVPFVGERAITDLTEGQTSAKVQYSEKLRKLLQFAAQKVEGYKYRLLTAHLFFANVKVGKTEQEITVSDTYAVEQSAIPETFQYVALGHVHRYQRLQAAKTDAFYTGSLYQLDFGEEGQDKFFNYVVIEDNRTRIEKVKLSLKRELKKVILSKESSPRDLLEFKKANLYLWVEIEASTPQEFALKRDQLERIFQENLLKVTAKFEKRSVQREERLTSEWEEIKDPLAMYRSYYEYLGRKWDNKLETVVKRLLEKVEI